jgi:hypothetical protein
MYAQSSRRRRPDEPHTPQIGRHPPQCPSQLGRGGHNQPCAWAATVYAWAATVREGRGRGPRGLRLTSPRILARCTPLLPIGMNQPGQGRPGKRLPSRGQVSCFVCVVVAVCGSNGNKYKPQDGGLVFHQQGGVSWPRTAGSAAPSCRTCAALSVYQGRLILKVVSQSPLK